MVRELPERIAACPLLEDWGFANRLASNAGLPGCFEGELSQLVTQLNCNAEFAYQNLTDLMTDQRLA
jgi:hypothetical protein